MFVDNVTVFQSQPLQVERIVGIFYFIGPGTYVNNRVFSYYSMSIINLVSVYTSHVRQECFYESEITRKSYTLKL